MKRYRELSLLDATGDAIANVLKEIGYVKEFNDKIRLSFDSDENVRKNYQGNYGLRLTDD